MQRSADHAELMPIGCIYIIAPTSMTQWSYICHNNNLIKKGMRQVRWSGHGWDQKLMEWGK